MRLVLSLLTNRYVLIASAFALTLLYAGCEHKRAKSWKEKYQTFLIQTEAVGKAQEAATKAKILSDKLVKDTADAEHAATVKSLNDTLSRLRSERASRSYLPPAAPGAPSAQRACLSRPDAERAIREFVEGAGRLLEEGDRAIVDLNTAKAWASAR
jgi:hypothetical protein